MVALVTALVVLTGAQMPKPSACNDDRAILGLREAKKAVESCLTTQKSDEPPAMGFRPCLSDRSARNQLFWHPSIRLL